MIKDFLMEIKDYLMGFIKVSIYTIRNFLMGLMTANRDIIRKLNKGANIIIASMGLLSFGIILLYFNLYSHFLIRLFFWLLVMGKTYVYLELHEWNHHNHELINKVVAITMFIVALYISIQ